MKYKKVNQKQYIIRGNRGEYIMESLKELIKKENIQGGFFFGVGAVDKLEIAHYNVGNKKYSSKKYNLPLEMTSLMGSISYFKEELIVHGHGVFGNKEMETLSGHLVDARISGTAEIIIIATGKLNKSYNEETGLKIFDI